MSANMTNRETIRDALATGLIAQLVTSKAVVASGNVYSHRVFDPQGASPIVGVFSISSSRPTMTFQGAQSIFRFGIEVWVRVQATSWTAANAEDRLDLIEKYIADYIMDNRSTSNWDAIEPDEEGSTVTDFEVGGVPYLHEIIPLTVYVHK